MTGDQIPDSDHLARYCRPRHMEDGRPRWGAFQPRAGEDYLSVNWLEFFEAPTLKSAVDEARRVFGATFDLGRSGRFAVLNVGDVTDRVQDLLGLTIRAEHLSTGDNPAHAGLIGYFYDDTEVARAIAEMVHRDDVYPALD